MILNAYAVLDAFVTLLRLLLGLGVVCLALPALRRGRRTNADGVLDQKTALEDRSYLLYLLAAVLLILNLVSWPLFYLLLQSYVSEWPGLMCIYGVTRIGTGSLGPSRFLPDLIALLQVLKPILVFLTGAWVVLYALNRRTRTAPLTLRVLLVVVLFGLVDVADASAEGAYLVIPKKEEVPSSGCCTAAFDRPARADSLFGAGRLPPRFRPWLNALFWEVNGCTCLALAVYAGWPILRRPGLRLLPLALTAAASWAVSLVYLVEIAAPVLLHLPLHHCPYDLIPQVPEMLVTAGLFVAGTFAAGWACVVGWLGVAAETRPLLEEQMGRILRPGAVAFAAALAMLFLELVLA
jgi:hypothetical protein